MSQSQEYQGNPFKNYKGGKLSLLRSFIAQHGCYAEVKEDHVLFYFRESPENVYTAKNFTEAYERLGL